MSMIDVRWPNVSTNRLLIRHPPDDRLFGARFTPGVGIGKPEPRRERPDDLNQVKSARRVPVQSVRTGSEYLPSCRRCDKSLLWVNWRR